MVEAKRAAGGRKSTPMRYRDLVPNFRLCRRDGETVVEVPPNYERMPNGRPVTQDGPDVEAHRRLRRLIHEGVPVPIFDEARAEADGRPGSHRLSTMGALIRRERYDMIMGQAVPGWFWSDGAGLAA